LENKYCKSSLSYEFFKKSITLIIDMKLFGVMKVCFEKSSFINNFFKQQHLFVYQGRFFINILINLFMVGGRIGNFIVTKKFNIHNSFKKIKVSKR
jgi:ribosomal protein S19